MEKIGHELFQRLVADYKSKETYAVVRAYVKAALAHHTVDDALETREVFDRICTEQAIVEASWQQRKLMMKIIRGLGRGDLKAWTFKGRMVKMMGKDVPVGMWFDASRHEKPKPTHCPTCGQALPEEI